MACDVSNSSNGVASGLKPDPLGSVFIQDCRSTAGARLSIARKDASGYDALVALVRKELGIANDAIFVITTTSRDEINSDTLWESTEDGDTLYILNSVDQELEVQAQEHVNFLPHYDTIVKGGMYEYYASEGQNPLAYALSELIDNSLAATAENTGSRDIDIKMLVDDEFPSKNMIIVLDNGKGMTSRQLNNWAIYRLSKFMRKDFVGKSNGQSCEDDQDRMVAPRSLNSDISYFGVGGKQAIFFMGNSVRMISRPQGCQDVHELTISKEEFEQKEKNKEAIYSGFIRNRKVGDVSHIAEENEMLRNLVTDEASRGSFTAVVITGISLAHVTYLRTSVKEWTRQLAQVYHYYIHGPSGNVDASVSSELSKKADSFSKINIIVSVCGRASQKVSKVINLHDIDDDMQSRYIRTAASTFEFKASIEGSGIVEGLIRYHPFLYDRETFPPDYSENAEAPQPDTEIDEEDSMVIDLRRARGKRPIFDCFWNGRLIPYSSIEEFEWCACPKKSKQVPSECYNRISGVLWTNDKFQVSTNKLTFIDLEMKLRDKNTTYVRIITKESKKPGKKAQPQEITLEKRTNIGREFTAWLKECHEQCDKQMKFCGFTEIVIRPELPRNRQMPWSVFKRVEWDTRVYEHGTLVRVSRVLPIAYGSIQRILLYGEHSEDVFSTGGEIEIQLEPRSLFDDIRKTFPLSKVDTTVSLEQIHKYIDDEEARLPHKLNITFPNGDEVKNGISLPAGATIGDIQVEIVNRKGEQMSKLPGGSLHKKLVVELNVIHHASSGDELVVHHISHHGKTWPYWFHKMNNIKALGRYTLELQALINESGANVIAGKRLPAAKLQFTITAYQAKKLIRITLDNVIQFRAIGEADPEKFSIGFLEGPFRIGSTFQIPLEFQDAFGNMTKPNGKLKPELSASGLKISFGGTQVKASTLFIKDIVALGSVPNGPTGTNFTLIVKVPGLKEDSNSLKIRLLPGSPAFIDVSSVNEVQVENGRNVEYDVTLRDQSGNPTTSQKLSIKFTGSGEPIVVPCPHSTVHITAPINVKTLPESSDLIMAKFEAIGIKGIPVVERSIRVLPSQRSALLEVYYTPTGGSSTLIKSGQEITGVCGEAIKDITFCIKDEGGREKKIDEDLASKIKVNWTPKMTPNSVIHGRLPVIKLPTLVADAKYCQVSLTDGSGLQVGFNVRGVAGEPASIKCSVMGSNQVRLGEKLKSDIQVLVRDAHGNEIKKFEKGVLYELEVAAEGLVRTEMVTMLGQISGFNIQGIKFEPGPIGSRELSLKWRNMQDFIRVEIVAGPPTKISLPGWELEKQVTLLNGQVLPREVTVQLCDDADNPSPVENILIQLIPDAAIKLQPSTFKLKTNKKGSVNFGVFTVTGKKGSYEIQTKAFVSRPCTLLGPSFCVNIEPDSTKPVSIQVLHDEMTSLVAGNALPDFTITVIGEHEGPITMAKASCLRMKVWRGGENLRSSASANVFSHAPDKLSPAEKGTFYFKRREVPQFAGKHSCAFNYVDDKCNIWSETISFDVLPRPPVMLVAVQNPGTPTVSNARNASSRTLVRNLQLELRDEYGNACGEAVSGEVTVEIASNSAAGGEKPIFVGNTNKLLFKMNNGKASLQNIEIQENTSGRDGQVYSLRCTLQCSTSSSSSISIPPFEVSFLFYNDAKKQAQMATLSKERDNLHVAVDSFKAVLNKAKEKTRACQDLLKEYQQEENKYKMELRRLGIPDNQLTVNSIDATLRTKQNEKQLLLMKPRRSCTLSPAPNDPEVIGKIGHLAEVVDADIARVLSWHMSADMDCVVTVTTRKAQEIHHQSQGRQQVLPLDSIFKKSLPEWNKPLPHQKMRPNWRPAGNPEFARMTLRFTKDAEHCRMVFGMLLGDTLLLDNLDNSTAYRQEIVKFTHCPTILTREGDRIRSNGKFGGQLNKAWPMEKLRGAVFGQPISDQFHILTNQIDVLQSYKDSITRRLEAEEDLNKQIQAQATADFKCKQRELQEAEEQLQDIDRRLGLCSSKSSTPQSSTRVSQSPAIRYATNGLINVSGVYTPTEQSPRMPRAKIIKTSPVTPTRSSARRAVHDPAASEATPPKQMRRSK